MTDTTLRAISLFSGAGGDTLGMTNAGIDVIGYVEFNKTAIQTHNDNFKNCVLIGEDITTIPDETFGKYKNIDIIFGGFPCQTFSHGGKKNPTDSRGFLYQEFVRAVKIIKPKIIIGENVKGLLSRKMEDGQLFINVITQEFQELGYKIRYKLFNMKNYGIPQSRERIIIHGIRNDLDIDIDLEKIKNLPMKYNRDILEFSLENALEITDDKELVDKIPDTNFVSDMSNLDLPIGTPPTNLIKCYNSDSISYRTRAKSTFSCVVDVNDVARTILCSYGRMPRLFVSVENNTGKYLRPYTIEELQQIQGFPKTFKFAGKYTDKINQIGNAIPPLFVTHIMTYIKTYLT